MRTLAAPTDGDVDWTRIPPISLSIMTMSPGVDTCRLIVDTAAGACRSDNDLFLEIDRRLFEARMCLELVGTGQFGVGDQRRRRRAIVSGEIRQRHHPYVA